MKELNPYSPPHSQVGAASPKARRGVLLMSALVGGAAPGLWLTVRNVVATNMAPDLGTFVVWFSRDLLLSLLLAVPVLAFAYHCGLRRPVALWSLAALVGAPMGYVLADPATFAWSPVEADFLLGPYWGDMALYMGLFGLSGFVYGTLRSRSQREV